MSSETVERLWPLTTVTLNDVPNLVGLGVESVNYPGGRGGDSLGARDHLYRMNIDQLMDYIT